MIEIYVATHNGRSPQSELKGQFGPEGGTVGRGADNQLVLPDRHVSRVQARVRYDGTRFLVANVSEANPLFLNDAEIESGSERPLVAGDELRIGLYVLGVRAATAGEGKGAPSFVGARGSTSGGALDPLAGLGGASAGPNPFADLLGGPAIGPPLSAGGGGLPSPPPLPIAELPRSAPGPSGAALSMPPTPATDAFADLLRPPAAEAPLPGSKGTPGAPRFSGRIPDDFNLSAFPSNASRNTDDPLRDLAGSAIDLKAVDANAKRSSLLEFDLTPKANPRDPLHGGTPSLVDSQQVVDPLRLFGEADDHLLRDGEVDLPAGGLPMRDNLPEIGAHFTPPRSLPPAPEKHPLASAPPASMAGPSAAPSPPPVLPVPAGRAPLGSAPAASTPTATAPLASEPAASTPTATAPLASAPAASTPAASTPATPATPAMATAVPPAAAPPPVSATTSSTDIDALLAAFLKGVRMTDTSAPVRLTPALMEMMGTLVYHATAGAMELIAARQITKREIRADVTMIVAYGNNPLKFLPTPEAAMLAMLGPKMPGFMSTGEAMQDAFDDLRAHEVGVIAGMRAALAEVLRRFDPVSLQERLGNRGLLDSLFPGARRARLWNQFESRFQEIYHEANDDFQSLFGEAFTKAYEDQIELERAHRRRS